VNSRRGPKGVHGVPVRFRPEKNSLAGVGWGLTAGNLASPAYALPCAWGSEALGRVDTAGSGFGASWGISGASCGFN